MKTIVSGSLVYVPASVELVQHDAYNRISRGITTPKPANCLVVSVDNSQTRKRCKIIYRGSTWHVDMKDVYEITDNKREENVSYTS